MSDGLMSLQELELIQKKLGYYFKDPQLLEKAFIHCSYVNEQRLHAEGSTQAHNERLEFLGDSVLGLIVASFLFRHYPPLNEGALSHLRSRLVDGPSCHRFLNKLQLQEYLRLGKGERNNGQRGRITILADLFEALIGAIYLDGGLVAAEQFFLRHFLPELEEMVSNPVRNWKAELQDYSQRHHQQTPHYEVLSESGPDHSKLFCVAVIIAGKEYGRAEGTSKKEAQQAAAEIAAQALLLK